ncbi:hypothetical protein C8R46DRAFT_1209654 [Mycena filopes]|nr:hypothetical protein C8R46DRAFT_1209654 [Mycena filopes]
MTLHCVGFASAPHQPFLRHLTSSPSSSLDSTPPLPPLSSTSFAAARHRVHSTAQRPALNATYLRLIRIADLADTSQVLMVQVDFKLSIAGGNSSTSSLIGSTSLGSFFLGGIDGGPHASRLEAPQFLQLNVHLGLLNKVAHRGHVTELDFWVELKCNASGSQASFINQANILRFFNSNLPSRHYLTRQGHVALGESNVSRNVLKHTHIPWGRAELLCSMSGQWFKFLDGYTAALWLKTRSTSQSRPLALHRRAIEVFADVLEFLRSPCRQRRVTRTLIHHNARAIPRVPQADLKLNTYRGFLQKFLSLRGADDPDSPNLSSLRGGRSLNPSTIKKIYRCAALMDESINQLLSCHDNAYGADGLKTLSVSGGLEVVCRQVTLTDATEAAAPRITSFIMSTMKHLELLRQLYDTADLEMAFLMPALWDGEPLGVLMFIPPTSQSFLKRIGALPAMCRGTCLVVALLLADEPLPPKKAPDKNFLPLLNRRVERAVLSLVKWRRSIREQPAYHVALSVLQLPTEVREFISSRASTVWFNSGNGDLREDQDTRHLLAVLRGSKFGLVPLDNSSADIVFIHVAALGNIHNLPHLAHRRRRAEVRFCLYGTHESIPLVHWGHREIYLLGGIVTFTPEALASDAFGVLRIIRDIHAHPLWTCYLLPQVLGIAVQLARTCADDTPNYTGAIPSNLYEIFEAIIRGQVALLQAPSDDEFTQQSDATRQWVVDFGVLRPQTTEDVLDRCLKAFDNDIDSLGLPSSSWTRLAQDIIVGDMRRMQVQPALMCEYRRFVVLDSESSFNVSSGINSVGGIEWGGLRSFHFGDNFKRDREFS